VLINQASRRKLCVVLWGEGPCKLSLVVIKSQYRGIIGRTNVNHNVTQIKDFGISGTNYFSTLKLIGLAQQPARQHFVAMELSIMSADSKTFALIIGTESSYFLGRQDGHNRAGKLSC
jgi:hypothetical protein